MIGRRGRVSEVLNRRRPLSLAMVRRLHEGLGIPAETLIRPSRTEA
jgi:HTH-type transcriptional regulator/antitoxin HigA